MKEAFKYAFPKTIPIMAGYIFLALPFGILAVMKGLPPIVPILMSVFIYSGSLQFPAVDFLVGAFDPINALVLTLMMGARHIFYGIAMLLKFSKLGNQKIYSIFSMSDETFTIYASLQVPAHINASWAYFFVGLLNQFYWILGTALGVLLGQFISFNTQGIEFILTALFITIFVENWLSEGSNIPATAGLGIAAVCLAIFGPSSFMIPAMILIIIFFLIDFRRTGVKHT